MLSDDDVSRNYKRKKKKKKSFKFSSVFLEAVKKKEKEEISYH